MRKLALHFLIAIFTFQTVSILAQTPEQQTAGYTNPGFTLNISEYHDGTMPKNTYALLVRLTNTSNEVLRTGGCLALRGMYNLSVVYNGLPMEETDAVRKLKKYRKEDGGCTSGLVSWTLKPGESHDDLLRITEFYDMKTPGTYEITASKETFPDYPDKSVTIKSNTITIVVPEPGSVTPR